MKIKSTFLIATTAIIFSCTPSQTEKEAKTTVTVNDTNIIRKSPEKMLVDEQTTFFTQAAIGGMTEIEASSNIIRTSRIPSTILEHAKMIKADHEKANQKIKQLAAERYLVFPAVMPEEKLNLLKAMESLEAEAKAEYYINLMIAEHTEAINIFNIAATMKDEPVATFAKQTLPILEHHYKLTKQIKEDIAKQKAGVGDDGSNISNKGKNDPAKNQN